MESRSGIEGNLSESKSKMGVGGRHKVNRDVSNSLLEGINVNGVNIFARLIQKVQGENGVGGGLEGSGGLGGVGVKKSLGALEGDDGLGKSGSGDIKANI